MTKGTLGLLWLLLGETLTVGPRCEVRVLQDNAVLATCNNRGGRLDCREGRLTLELGDSGRRFGQLLAPENVEKGQKMVCHLLGQKTIPENGRRIAVEVCALADDSEILEENQTRILAECDQSMGRRAFLEAAEWLQVFLPSTRGVVHRRLQQVDPPANGWWPGGNAPWGGFGHRSKDTDGNPPAHPFKTFNDTNGDGIPDEPYPDSSNRNLALGLGIGLGVGLGVPVLVAIVALVCLCSRSRRSQIPETAVTVAEKSDQNELSIRRNYITIASEGELETIKEETEQASGAQGSPSDSHITVEINGGHSPSADPKVEGSLPAELATIVTTEDSGSREEYQPLP